MVSCQLTINMKTSKNFEVCNYNISKRATLRGLKKCPNCGQVNGARAQICRNSVCELRIKILATHRSFDPVQLLTNKTGIAIYSLRSKERDAQPRNFVSITDVTESLAQNSAVVSRNAICYSDTCRSDTADKLGNICKHVKACCVDSLPKAEAYIVEREILNSLIISEEQKQLLWNMCRVDVNDVPAVQRLNASTFAVKCAQSSNFPIGLLHVTALSDGLSSKKGVYACACKKLKIIVEPDNSLVMQNEICNHLFLVLAAILSKPEARHSYGNFINAFKPFCLLEVLFAKSFDKTSDDAFMGSDDRVIDENFTDSKNQHKALSDELLICLFGDEYLAHEKLSGLCERDSGCSALHTVDTAAIAADVLRAGDPNLVSSCDSNQDDDVDFQLRTIINSLDTNNEATQLELSDCNIELMDQFQLTDQIDLCSEDITIPIGNEPINILAPSVYTESLSINESAAIPVMTTDTTNTVQTEISQSSVPLPLPPIELPTIAVVKKTPIKASEIVNEVKTRKHPYVPAKRALIVNSTNAESAQTTVGNQPKLLPVQSAPALTYSAWLDYVIEALNENIEPSELAVRKVEQEFYVHKEMFAHFCKSFSTGLKRRTPSKVCSVEQGKYKGFNKYIWLFNSAPTVKRIFTTQNVRIQIERAFARNEHNSFVPYVNNPLEAPQNKYRRIYAKLSLYFVHILFDCASEQHPNGLHIAWIPDVLPKSQFGLLSIAFTLRTRNPNQPFT